MLHPPPPSPQSTPERWLRIACGLLTAGITVPMLLLVLVFFVPSRATRIRISNHYGRVAARMWFWIAGAQAQPGWAEFRSQIDAHHPAIYLMNHTSNLDIFTAIAGTPVGGCGVGKRQVLHVPFIGIGAWLGGHIFLDRSNRDRAVASMRHAAELVNRHRLSVFMFPEGTIPRAGEPLLPFKRGFAHLALQTRLPLVPIICRGAGQVWPGRTLQMHRGVVAFQVLEPIPTTEWSTENLTAQIHDVHQVFAHALVDRHDNVDNPPA